MVLAVFPYVLSDFPTTPQPLHRPLQMNPKNVAKIPLIHLDICACFFTGPTMESFLDWKKGKTILGTFGTNKIDRRRGAKGRVEVAAVFSPLCLERMPMLLCSFLTLKQLMLSKKKAFSLLPNR